MGPSLPARIGAIILAVLGCLEAAAAKQFVAVPEIEWEALVPYVRANIVAYLDGDDFQVFVCEDQMDSSVQSPFDATLGDFAKILVVQGMRQESRVHEGIGVATEGFRRRLSALTQDERARFRELFWEELSASPDVLPRLRALFIEARRAGRLRCWACEKNSGFAPLARRIAKGK